MAMKLKRGTTESWAFGPELVDFGRSSTKGKDSVIRAEGTELEMYVYTTSANEWYIEDPRLEDINQNGKTPGLPIDFGIKQHNHDKAYRLVVDFEGPEDCNLELVGWTGVLEQPDYSDGPYVDGAYQSSSRPIGFVKWPAEKVGVVEPVPVKIRVSYREVGAYEELEEGQLGLEYADDGSVKLKAGMPSVSKWNELPYIGAQADWNVADENHPEAIKNKPFGHVIYIGEIVNNYTSCSEPMEGAGVVIGGYNPTNMKPNTPYDIWLNDNYLGTHTSNQRADIDIEGIVGLTGGTLVIYGTSTPGNYHILVCGAIEEDRKIDSVYLNTYEDLYEGEPNDPVSCQVVRSLASEFGGSLTSLQAWQGVVSQDLSSLDEALDRIIAIQKELIGVTLITFITPTGEYQAEEGMTWGEWIDSQYNIDGFVINGSGWVEDGDGRSIYDVADGGLPEEPSYMIIAGHTYIYD